MPYTFPRLGLSAKTVKKHVVSMLWKTNARNRTMLVTLQKNAAQ
jgi:DNA-binding NarL/FixJ family response regulator